MRNASRRAIAALLPVVAICPAARALTFNLTFDSTVTARGDAASVMFATNYAAQQLQMLYSDPITINVTVHNTSTPGALGASNTFLSVGATFSQLRTAFSNDSKTSNDTFAVTSLGLTDPLGTGTTSYTTSTAEARASGLTNSGPASDGTYSFGNQVYTYDPANRQVGGAFDYIAVTQHELTEIMGRIDLLGQQTFGTGTPQFDPLDLFRYTAPATRSLGAGNQPNTYFSIDGGVTNLKNFNNGANGGDYGDWASGTNDAFNAFSSSGVRNDLSVVDLIEMDAIGYDLTPTWQVNASGNWSVPTNWQVGVPNAVGATANFYTINTAARTITVDLPVTVGSLNFSGPNAYTIAGISAITLDVASGNANLNTIAGGHTISAPVVLNDNLTVSTLDHSGVAVTGNLTAIGRNITKLGGGTAQFENIRAAGLTINGGSITISAKGTPNSASGTSVVTSLSISSNGTSSLNLTNNSMIIDYSGAVGSLVNDTRLNLQSGRLTSSSADAHHQLGYGDNQVLGKANFAGQNVDATSLLIKYTFGGDANLDGQVDVTDLGALATNWQTSAPWTGGDFNYDGFVDVTDLGALATNWQQGVGSPLGEGSFQAALDAVGLGNVSVPEPVSLAALSLCLAAAASRRRARRPH